MAAAREAYDELYVYTMGRPGFVLQHVVDAFGAQTATEETKPIGVVFALIGLYLRVEKRYSGTQVQQVHQQLASLRKPWPRLALPRTRGDVTAADVMRAPEGEERDRAIDEWCRSVWAAYRDSHQTIAALLEQSLAEASRTIRKRQP